MAAKQKNTIRTSVLLPEETHVRVQALAETNDVSVAWVIRHAIQHFLESYEDQPVLPLQMPKPKNMRYKP